MDFLYSKETEAGLRVKVPRLFWWHKLLCYYKLFGETCLLLLILLTFLLCRTV